MSDLNPSSPTPATPVGELSLAELYPACFDWQQPQPLKLHIHRDLIAAGHDRPAVRQALADYCTTPRYRTALQAGAPRIDLHGRPAGVVSEPEAEHARTALTPRAARAAAARAARPPNDTPLPKENLVPGRLELTVKFSELPPPLRVQDGIKIGIQTGEGTVTAILPPPLWRKLEQAAQTYPHWVAALSGSLDRHAGEEIALKHPTVQVFEKKTKPEAAPDARVAAAKAPDSKAPAVEAPEPPPART